MKTRRTTRKIVSIILVLLGLVVFLFAMYAKHRVGEVKRSVHNGTQLFSNNPVDKEITKALNEKLGSYDMPILWAMIGGVVLVVLGVGTFAYGKKR